MLNNVIYHMHAVKNSGAGNVLDWTKKTTKTQKKKTETKDRKNFFFAGGCEKRPGFRLPHWEASMGRASSRSGPQSDSKINEIELN